MQEEKLKSSIQFVKNTTNFFRPQDFYWLRHIQQRI